MRTLIVYASSHGTTEKAARLLRGNLEDDVEIVNLKTDPAPQLEKFDLVIIGGSIHAGTLQKRVRKFVEKNLAALLQKRVALFLCCMEEGEKAWKQFEQAYRQELREASLANGLFGGEFIFSRMNFLERALIKKISGIKSDLSRLDLEAIKAFAATLKAKI